MPKHTLNLSRLKELFDEELPQPEPQVTAPSQTGMEELATEAAPPGEEPGTQAEFLSIETGEAVSEASAPMNRDRQDLQLPKNEPGMEKGQNLPAGSLRWETFLDAIQRDEQIGYRYEQKEIVPLPTHSPEHEDNRRDPPGSKGNIPNTVQPLAVPLAIGDENFGLLELEADPDHPWTEQEASLVADVAQQIALHLENLRLLAQTEQYRKEAEDAVRHMTRQGWENFLAPASRAEAPTAPVLGYTYDQNRVLPLESLSHNDDGLEQERSHWSNAVRHSDTIIEDRVITPIKVRAETIGELVIDGAASAEGISAGNLVETIAERLSTHLESLRLLEETENARLQLDRRAAELETVARVSTAAATILDPQILLQAVANLTCDSFKLYGVHIYLVEEHTSRLILMAMAGTASGMAPGEKHIVRLDQEEFAVASAARGRSGVRIDDVRLRSVYRPYPHLPDAVSELAVPMIVGDQVLGVFGVLSESANRFFPDDMRTFSTLASQVAIALRNAELYAEQMATVTRLRELDHLKSAFLANMSHELRTPLNSILGFTQVILEELDGPLTSDMLNDLRLIEKNGKHLLQLINDVLDMAKIEAGRMTLSLETFNLGELLEDVLETTGPLAREKALCLQLAMNPLEPLNITADRFRMRQILLNLVGNSVKFTENGSVTVHAEKWDEVVLVTIRDTGIGIPPGKLESIFDAFSQVDTSTTRKVGGTGLGLPISRRLVEMHGGRLWAESNGSPGEGSTFFLELPLDCRLRA